MSSLLEQEILSQPDVLARLLNRETLHVQQIVASLPHFDYILIAARGSSDHAALYATYAWAALAGYPVSLATPSLYTLYSTPPRLQNAFVIGISQSGQSPDIIAVLEEGKKQGCPTLAITNDGNSPLASIADHVIELQAGPERSIAATKTYITELAVIALFAAAWNNNPQHFDEIARLPDALRELLRASTNIARYAERYRYMDRCVVVGRGYNYATAFELALKLKELTYVMATAYSSADFRHGPIATIEAALPTILIMPSGVAFNDMHDLAHDLLRREAELLVISDAQQGLRLARTPISLPASVPEWLSPVTAVVPGQLLALSLALAKDFDPDVPRGLHKVTRTF